MTEDQYLLAKEKYLSGDSLSKIAREMHICRGKLSEKLKKDGIEILNRQNAVKLNEDFFEKIDTENKAYWLGFMYADGYVSKNDNGIELSLKSSDIGHLKKFIKDLSFNKKLYKDETRCRLTFRNKKMHSDLVQKGCIPQKSLILTFPKQDQVPLELMRHFIRGYIDGDGSIMIGKNHLGEYVKPRLNILGTKEFLTSLIEQMSWKQNKISPHSGTYSIEWSGFYVEEYLDFLYQDANIYLDRKYEKYRQIKDALNCRSKK